MSSPNESSWFTPIMIVLVGGLAVYGMARGPGNCPFVPNSQSPGASVPLSQSVGDGRLVHADESTFDEAVLQADGPVLVDFYADWCGPCQQLAPVLERVSEDLTDGRIVKVNTDHNPQLANRYGITALPTLLVFEDGQVVQTSRGYHDEQEVRELLQR